MSTPDFTEGTVLTCAHDGCNCRIVVQNACHCDHQPGATYTCTCGAPMKVVQPQHAGA